MRPQSSVWLWQSRVSAAQYKDGSPEATIVALFRAMYSNDVAAFEQLTMPNPERRDSPPAASATTIDFAR